jgi:hypothetical protein
LTLAKYANDDKWKVRAYQYATLSFDKDIVENFTKNENPVNRQVLGTPDRPYSLMEGMGGDIILYVDLVRGDGKFPGYEI